MTPATLRDGRHVTIALAIAAGVGWLGFPGLLWDVAWHRTVGRDSFLSPPHVLMYAGVAANGLVAAWALASRIGHPGVGLVGIGFALAIVGAVLDEAWHRLVGKDVNLWSPPHLVGLAGTVVIVVGLALAVAARSRDERSMLHRVGRVVLIFLFADLLHKSTVALDHYSLDAWGRTADFYPFLIALLQPAILVAAVRSVGAGAAVGTALVFSLQHIAIVMVLQAAGMRTSTISPLPILPALAIDAVALCTRGAVVPILAGVLFPITLYAQESASMRWLAPEPWEWVDVARGLPPALLAGIGSAWVGWIVGTVVTSAERGQTLATAFGTRARARVLLLSIVALVALGAFSAYRPSRLDPPAPVARLGLAADTSFDHRDATFWTALLPDDWERPGPHETYQEAIIDGRPVPLGPAWCGRDDATLTRTLASVRFGLAINGEPVALDRFPRVRQRLRDGRSCEWVGVAATTPRPGDQRLVYELEYRTAVESSVGIVGPGTTRVVITLRVKEP
jgi:hypothetical protein